MGRLILPVFGIHADTMFGREFSNESTADAFTTGAADGPSFSIVAAADVLIDVSFPPTFSDTGHTVSIGHLSSASALRTEFTTAALVVGNASLTGILQPIFEVQPEYFAAGDLNAPTSPISSVGFGSFDSNAPSSWSSAPFVGNDIIQSVSSMSTPVEAGTTIGSIAGWAAAGPIAAIVDSVWYSEDPNFIAPLEPQDRAGHAFAASAVGADIGSSRPLGLNQADAEPPGAPGPPATLQTLANYLTDGFWGPGEFGGGARHFNLTNSGTGANNGVVYFNVTGFSGLAGAGTDTDGISAARQETIRNAFDMYEDILGINFIETTGQADQVDLYFKDNVFTTMGGERAFANSQKHAGSLNIDYSWVNITPGWNGGSTEIGSYTFQTAMHEIGHALGLGHQGLYNAGAGNPTYNDAYWQNDSWQATMMSYWDQIDNTYIDASYARLISPMSVDWIALNSIYGGMGYGVSNAFAGDTTWGFNTTITASMSAPVYNSLNIAFSQLSTLAATHAFTIVDGSGIDTLDFSGFSANQLINLAASSGSSISPSISNIGGLIGNMTIAEGTVIENAIGGSGGDNFTGNTANNTFRGNGGNDTMDGGGGTDSARFAGNRSAYTLTDLGGGSVRVVGPDGTDTLSSIERLVFDDQTLSWPLPGSVSINDVAVTEGQAGAKLLTFTVTRTGGAGAFNVSFATANGSATVADGDYVGANGTLVFGAGVNIQNVSVTINGDTKAEFSEDFFVNLSGATNGATISGSQGRGTIVNDDGQPPVKPPYDFNADLKGDILFQEADGRAAVWLMNGAGIVDATVVGFNPGASWDAVGSGDFNADLKADVLFQEADGRVAIWQMNGASILDASVVGFNPGAVWDAIGAGDFNGDGKADVLFQQDGGRVAIWQMNGASITDATVVGFNPGASWEAVGAGDFNGDGKADVLFQEADGRIAIWQMNGASIAYSAAIGFNPGAAWEAIGAGDFNGDGKADVLFQEADGRVAIWQMDGANLVNNTVVPFNPGASWDAIRAGDFNGDGKADVLFQEADGRVAVWQMNGASILDASVIGFNPGASWDVIG